MSVLFLLALLAFSSLTAASDPGCDELIKPLEDRSKIYGKWILHTATADSEDKMKTLQVISSSWVEISPIPGSDGFTMHNVDRIEGECHHGTVNFTTSGSTVKVTYYYNSTAFEHTGRYLETCPDCVLWTDETISVEGVTEKGRTLFLFTKTGRLDASHLDVFRKQAKCINLVPDLYFPVITDLCPEEKKVAAAGEQ